MLEGITVLNQEMIIVNADWAIILCILSIFGALCGVFMLFVSLFLRSDGLLCIGAAIALGFGVCGLIISSIPSEVKSGRYRYEVTIDESVSFNDIYEKYEIIEQRGDIWVLEEKEQ